MTAKRPSHVQHGKSHMISHWQRSPHDWVVHTIQPSWVSVFPSLGCEFLRDRLDPRRSLLRTYMLVWFETVSSKAIISHWLRIPCTRNHSTVVYLPVSKPLVLWDGSFLDSRISKNVSKPLISGWLNPYRNARHNAPTPNMVVEDVSLQGREGHSAVAPESPSLDMADI